MKSKLYMDLDIIDASFIINKLFKKDIPVWLCNGQLNDLKELDQSDLRVLNTIDELPLENIDFIAHKMNRPDILLRLLKRYEIVQAINEHLTSKIYLEEK